MSKSTHYCKCWEARTVRLWFDPVLWHQMTRFTNVSPLFGFVVALVAAGLHARFRAVDDSIMDVLW
jgi:hypothetical protein